MGGALLQLVAYGAQDIYLTGNPQITFFKVVYRRHTNFAVEAVQQSVNGVFSSSGVQTTTISRNGDLVGRTYIEVKDNTFGMQEGDVYDLLNHVEVQIGGQRIDQQWGDWNAIWWELTTPEGHVNAKRASMIENSGSVDASNSGCYYPLNFWFCRNPGLYLPLIALQYHEVKLKITWGTVPTSATLKLWCDYIYLDTDERRRFAQVSHEYLIEQVQRQTFTASTTEFSINFCHPIKELVWVSAGNTNGFGAGCQFTPLRNAGATTSNTPYTPGDNDDEITVKLQLNGNDRFASRDAKYFKYIKPMEHHTRVPAPKKECWIAGDNDAIPIDDNNDGTNIMYVKETARLTKATLHITTAPGQTDQTYRLTNGTLGDPDASFLSGATTAIANSTGDITFTEGAQSATNGQLNMDHSLIVEAGSYIGVKKTAGTDGSAVGFLTANVEILPTLISGDSANTANIYCYSFALKPEDHQPTGTCNFSRIDNAKLIFSQNVSANGTLKVFGVNYNVLRIMSGMAGLGFSN
jgi:hypothetical protein